MKRSYSFRLEKHALVLTDPVRLILPMALRVNGKRSEFTLCPVPTGTDSDLIIGCLGTDLPRDAGCLGTGHTPVAEYASAEGHVLVHLDADCLRFSFTRTFEEETAVFESEAFAGGLRFPGMDRALSTQARNNNGLNMEFFHCLPDVSANGYFIPPELNMILGSAEGWIALGLLDLPDSKQVRIQPDLSVLVESCGGNKRVTEYTLPELLLSFPEDEWQAVSLFRQKLIDYGRLLPKKPAYHQVPAWWKDPLICTYGDQLIQDRVGALIDEDWIMDFVRCGEEKWGHKQLTLIIDDSWQHIHSFEPRAEAERFPDMRAMIDRLHARGHHVVLWTQPLFDSVINGFEPLSRQFGVLSDYFLEKEKGDYYLGCYSIDYTRDRAREYLRTICEGLFGTAPGQFAADGVKLDFMGMLRDPAETASYAHPEKGVGIRELYHFYAMFAEEARRIRPDVLIDCTVGDPRFEEFITHNRLHDTHAGVEEKELRARLSTLACPDLPVDSDGALMYSSWLRRHYINAAIYSIPSNYYLNGFQDFHAWPGGEDLTAEEAVHFNLTAREKKAFGTLFGMARFRPDGHAVTDGSGSWKLIDANGQVNALSLYGDTVIYYPTKPGETGYIFTLRDEAMTIPLFGRRITAPDPAPHRDFLLVDYARGRMTVHLKRGVLHTFRWAENSAQEVPGIDRALASLQTESAETEMNYVN